MKYQKNYYYFKSAFSSILCDKIIKEGKSNNIKMGATGHRDPRDKFEVEEVKKKRDSNIAWIEDIWLKKELHYYVNRANRMAGWNFDIIDSEACQFTIYDKGQYYGWHTDSDGEFYQPEKNRGNLMRKLSVTVSLSDQEEYEGGLLQFDIRNKSEPNKSEIITCREILPRGSIVVFPSYTWHRVSPVTRGTRLSLVQWNYGPGYK